MKHDSINVLEKVIHYSIEIHESSLKIYYHTDIHVNIIYWKSLIKHNLMNSIIIQSFIKRVH